ncbi:MAG: phosphatidate cytidylyltransferase [Actinomycetota bacterium]
MKLRIATGVVLAAVALGLASWGSGALFGLVFAVVMVAQGEFYRAARKAGYHPATALGLVAGGALLLGTYTRGEQIVGVVFFLTVVLTFVWYAARKRRDNLVIDYAVTLLGLAYVPLLGAFAGLLLRRPDGRGALMATIAAVAIYDIFAYFGGRLWGKRLLAPSISPKKTREGAAVATAAVLVPGALLAHFLGPWNLFQAFVFAGLIAIAAPLGDLFESLLKRDLDLKDMGSILPGHGGALDRIDALLFCTPVAYISLQIFNLS